MKQVRCDIDDRIVFHFNGIVYRKKLEEIIVAELKKYAVGDLKNDEVVIFLKQGENQDE